VEVVVVVEVEEEDLEIAAEDLTKKNYLTMEHL
jgi:hypothetical protein